MRFNIPSLILKKFKFFEKFYINIFADIFIFYTKLNTNKSLSIKFIYAIIFLKFDS